MLPPEKVRVVPEHAQFPGAATGDVKLTNSVVTVDLLPRTWVSTGLWLPAGVVGTVESDVPGPDDLSIQIGSHEESLFRKAGPWRRWPTTVSQTRLGKGKVQIVSPFGGIIYIVVGQVDEGKTITLHFSQVYHHSIMDVERPAVWEATKSSTAPWAEVVSTHVVFTVPRGVMDSITDLAAIKRVYDAIIDAVSSYLSFEVKRPFRIVFDIDLPDDNPTCGYPFVFPVDMCEDLLVHLDAATFALLNAVMMIGILSIREGCFDTTAETVIGTIAAAVALERLFPSFNVEEVSDIELPSPFHELWSIQKRVDPTLIPRAIAVLQDPAFTPPASQEVMWAEFVKELCRLGHRDFTPLLERSRPILLSDSFSEEDLSVYQFVVS
jgi:hypothetical protein